MSDRKIISSEAMSNAEVLKELKQRSENSEITYREEKSLEYLKKVVKIDFDDFGKIKDELIKLEIPRLDEEYLVKIIEIMPKTGTELRSILSNTGTILVDENVTKILNTLKKFN